MLFSVGFVFSTEQEPAENPEQFIQKNIWEFCEAIARDNYQSGCKVLARLTTDEEILEVINCETGLYHKDGQSCNSLHLAVMFRRYKLVKYMLNVLEKIKDYLKGLLPLIVTNENGNNALQLLIFNTNSVYTVSEERNLLDNIKLILRICAHADIKRKISSQHDSLLMSVIRNKNKQHQSSLTLAVVRNHEFCSDLLAHLFRRLRSVDKVAALTEKHPYKKLCNNKIEQEPHLNLLTLALAEEKLTDVEIIVETIQSHLSENERMLIAVGDGSDLVDPDVNSIRIAAKNGLWTALDDVLKLCVPREHRYTALVKPDKYIGSALQWILRGGSGSTTNFAGATNVLRDQLTEIKDNLAKELESGDTLYSFLHLEMSVNAVKEFYDAGLFEHSYLLPKPSKLSGLSRPEAMIFYNTFDYPGCEKKPLPRTKEEAEKMRDALQSINWVLNSRCIVSNWSSIKLSFRSQTRMK